jgi:isopentenyldiphosphate isomerase
MSAEIFDVVNERDEVIGQQERGEVHRLGLMHRAVHVLVFNAAGQIFLQKRSMSKDRQPGLWDSSASGHVDAGEAYDACAVRELHEEIGLQLDATPKRLFKDGGKAGGVCRRAVADLEEGYPRIALIFAKPRARLADARISCPLY